jgi:hypothetical protein
MTMAKRLIGIVVGTCALIGTAGAEVAQPLVILADQSMVLAMKKTPGTVVVGNPSIADVSLQGMQLFVHGRSYGTTNVIILDEQGGQIANYEVTVQSGGTYNVSMYKAGLRYSYTCAPDCEVQMHVGDDPSFFKDMALDRNKDKINLATGQKGTEANQPPPAQ